MRGRDDLYFALTLILSGKLNICGIDDLFFALPMHAAPDFKFFFNAALCVKSLPTPTLAGLFYNMYFKQLP